MSLKNLENPIEDSIQEKAESIEGHEIVFDKLTAITVLRAYEFLYNDDQIHSQSLFEKYESLKEQIRVHDEKMMVNGKDQDDSIFGFHELLEYTKIEWEARMNSRFNSMTIFEHLGYRFLPVSEFEKFIKKIDKCIDILEYLNYDLHGLECYKTLYNILKTIRVKHNYYFDTRTNEVVVIGMFDRNKLSEFENHEFYLGINKRYEVDTADLYLIYLRANFVYNFIEDEDQKIKFLINCLFPLTVAQFNIQTDDKGNYLPRTFICNKEMMFFTETIISEAFIEFVSYEKMQKLFPGLYDMLYEKKQGEGIARDNFAGLTITRSKGFDIYHINFKNVFKNMWDLSVFDYKVLFGMYHIEIPTFNDNNAINRLESELYLQLENVKNLKVRMTEIFSYETFTFNKFIITREDYERVTMEEYIEILSRNLYDDIKLVMDMLKPNDTWITEKERKELNKLLTFKETRYPCDMCPLLSICNDPNPTNACKFSQEEAIELFFKFNK